MYRILKFACALAIPLVMIFTTIACSSDDDEPSANKREVVYTITGNYTGTVFKVSYITANGGATQESITTLPWTKEITYLSTVAAATMTVAGAGGTAGQTITLKVVSGGKEISSSPATADAGGSIVVAAPSIVF